METIENVVRDEFLVGSTTRATRQRRHVDTYLDVLLEYGSSSTNDILIHVIDRDGKKSKDVVEF